MIKTFLSKSKIEEVIKIDFIQDKQPLRDYAGFASGSEYEGLARQTFSIVLSSESIDNIRASVEILYNQLLSSCWPKDKIMPFDMIRFDAFFDSNDNTLKIIELNTRNVGLHEIVEWIDEVTARELSESQSWSLNKEFVKNQKTLHTNQLASNTALLYMTNSNIPKWKYFDELVAAYDSVCHITGPESCNITTTGVSVKGMSYSAITRKFSWPTEPAIEMLDTQNLISIMQPLWMRPFGRKDYLHKLQSSAILRSEDFTTKKIDEYTKNKNALVLKITKSGGSKSIYLGPDCSDKEWRKLLLFASQNPESWVMQEYTEPTRNTVIVHGVGTACVPIQLGIFVLPDSTDPGKFKMDIVVKGYGGQNDYFKFDPSGLTPDIWFGNVIEASN